MSLVKTYSPINWENYPSEATPINESNLNKMDSALNEIDNRVISMDTTKADKTTTNNLVEKIEYDEETGIFTITKLNGVTSTFDTNLEKIAVNFDYDKDTGKLIIDLEDGTQKEVDLSALIDTYDFQNSETISYTLVGNTVIPSVIKGSITGEYLEPNYLANVTVQAQIATEKASDSEASALRAELAQEKAEEAQRKAEEVSNVEIATTEKAGIVKPDGTTIEVDEYGTIRSKGGNANSVKYDNTESGLEAENVQSAIDELSQKPSGIREITKAEFEALEDKSGTYIVTDEDFIGTASAVEYDDSVSKLGTDNVQDAIDKMVGTYSNPNLLDNPWFTVNQRGKTTYNAVGYTVDRWKSLNKELIVNVNADNTITISNNGTINTYYRQILDIANSRIGSGVYTASIEVIDVNGVVDTWIYGLDTGNKFYQRIKVGMNVITDTLNKSTFSNTSRGIDIRFTPNSSITIKAVKLELGSVSTLANDVAPDYNLELAKCLLSTADSSDTYANRVPNFAPNPNLLDNPWFTVNQRGKTSANALEYIADRWLCGANNTAKVNTDKTITISGTGWFIQKLEEVGLLDKMLTYSVMLSDGTSVYGSNIIPSTKALWNAITFYTDNDVTLQIQRGDNSTLQVGIIPKNNSVTIKAVKLELGSVSTLALDTVPNYQQELAKCQRHCQRICKLDNLKYALIGTGVLENATEARVVVPLSVPLRKSPTITYSGTLALSAFTSSGKKNIVPTSIANNNNPSTTTVTLKVVIPTTTGVTSGNYVELIANNDANAYVELSADL